MGLDINKSCLHAKSWHFLSIFGGAVGQKLSRKTAHAPCIWLFLLFCLKVATLAFEIISDFPTKWKRIELHQILARTILKMGKYPDFCQCAKTKIFFVFLVFFCNFFLVFLFFHFF